MISKIFYSLVLFPNIVNATVYDLSTQKTVADWIVGSSYSELMMTHFGLENEYSNIADDIIETTQSLVDNQQLSPQEKFEQLKKLFDDNEKYLSPSSTNPKLGRLIELQLEKAWIEHDAK